MGVRLSHLKPHSASDWPCGLRQLTEASPALSVFLCAVAMFPALSRGANRVPRACRALRMAPRTRVPLRGEGSCGGGGAPRDSAGSGATEEGLTSRGGLLPGLSGCLQPQQLVGVLTGVRAEAGLQGQSLSHVCLFATPWTAAPQVLLSTAMRETWVQSLGWEDPLEKGTATHSSILAWRIP